jgi:4'-phosphopantetheinyl transferase
MTTPVRWLPAPSGVRLDEGEAHVWLASLDVTPARLAPLRALLNDEERARADRFLQKLHRIRSAAARGILRQLLGRYLDVEPGSVQFQTNAFGKPSLAGPAGHFDLRFNLSHSHGLALFAFARGRELGVDLERIRPTFDTLRIAGRFFAPAEAARLRALSPEEQPFAFFECWSRKEAYIKARGDGLHRRLDSFEVAFGPGVTPALLRSDDEPDAPVRWAMFNLEPAHGFAGALAIEQPTQAVHCWRLD